MTGKVTPDGLLSQVFTRTGSDDTAVLQGPADGEDAAAIDPDRGTLVVSSDPVSLTAMGVGEFVPTGGATPGDRLLLTGGAAIEGTAILAADFGKEFGVDPAVCERGEALLGEISVVRAARALREHATAMHDPTEGGVLAGFQELARAAGVRLDVDSDATPVRPETQTLCDAAGVDPLRILGSGAVVAAVPDDSVDDALAALDDADVEGAVVGTVQGGEPTVALDGERFDELVADDLYALWESG
jgi:hydrogenase expression/formation protein HypE